MVKQQHHIKQKRRIKYKIIYYLLFSMLHLLVFVNEPAQTFKLQVSPLVNLKKNYISPLIKNLTSVKIYKQTQHEETEEANHEKKNCIIFFTGASSFISPKIYNNFFTELMNNNIDVYVPSFNYNNYNILVQTLKNEYGKVIIAGHSSGATVALKNIESHNNNQTIEKVILLDPVNTRLSNTSKPYNIESISSILYLYALKSYKITFDPFGLPFIPILKIPPQLLTNQTSKNIKIITAKNHGHADILNKEYGDFMHNTRIAVGNKNRTEENINDYHKWLSHQIKSYIE